MTWRGTGTGSVAKLKLFGDRNTGTIALTRLVNANSATRVLPASVPTLPLPAPIRKRLQQGLQKLEPERREARLDTIFRLSPVRWTWKHAATHFTPAEMARFRDVPVVILVRHPASWLRSLHRNPYHALAPVPERLEDFVAMSWPTVGRERLGSRVLTPVTLYNEKIASYLAFADALVGMGGKVEFVRFEDFVIDQLAVFERLRPLLRAPKADPSPVLRSTKDRERDHRYYADYYGRELWRAEISDGVWAQLATGIDWGPLTRFGYAPGPSGTARAGTPEVA